MSWIFTVLMALSLAFASYKRAKRAGLWSWPKFLFAIGFALFETALVTVPVIVLNPKNPYFWPAYGVAWVIAAVFFVLFIIVMRKWKLPDGRTSLEAEAEVNGKEAGMK
jgi:Na+/melibiose symporter-like transporter